MANLTLYTLTAGKVDSWQLQTDTLYTIKNDLFDSDIYCESVGSGFTIIALENQNIIINIEPDSVPLKILNNQYEWLVEGSFCSLNDLWLNINDESVVISKDQLDLTDTNIDYYKNIYSNNINYNVYNNIDQDQPTSDDQALNREIEGKNNNNAYEQTNDDNRQVNQWEELEETGAPDEAPPHVEVENGDPIFEQDSEDLTSEFNHIVTRAQDEKRSRILFIKLEYINSLKKNKFVKSLIRWYLYLREWIKENIILVSIIGIVLILAISIGLTFLISNIQDKNIQKSQSSAYEHIVDQNKLVLLVTKNLPIINLNVYREYGKFIINGLIINNKQLNLITDKIKKLLAEIPISINLITLDQLINNVQKIEDIYSLSCKISDKYDSVSCIGMVINQDHSKEEISRDYKYNKITPLNLQLLKRKDIITFLDQMFADKSSFNNVSYELDSTSLTLNGYISQTKLNALSKLNQQITEKMPFLTIKNNLKLIEKTIDLSIKEIIFNKYGNTIVDLQDNEYNVGSVYKNFIIVSIQKNNIVFQSGTNTIILPTPFNTDNFVTFGLNGNNQAASDNSTTKNSQNLVDNLFQAAGYPPSSPSMSPPVDRNGIIAEERSKTISDINKKKQILEELTQAKKHNENAALNHAYDDLIANLTSDIMTEEQDIKLSATASK